MINRVQSTMNIHSCSYYCDRPECIKEQRDTLVNRFIVNAIKPLMESDLRKAAQMALEALEGFVYHGIGPNSGPALASLRAALAQPEQDLQLVANLLKEYGLEALEVIAALKTQPEPMFNGLTEEETNASASVMGLTQHQRKPLTDQEIIKAIKHISHNEMSAFTIARAIENVLKNAPSEANKGTYDQT